MNRKLLNGLLVLTVAASGVGTFTSCKDEDVRNDIIYNQQSLEAQIKAIRGMSDAEFQKNLEAWLNSWTSSASSNGFQNYDEFVAAANVMNQIYQSIMSDTLTPDAEKYVDALYGWLFDGKEIQKQDWYELMNALLNLRASSVELNQTINPVFGSINLPIGLKTTMLATYLYQGSNDAEYMFPTQVRDAAHGSHLALDFDQYQANIDALNTIQELAAGKAIALENGTYSLDAGFGSMGSVYVNINPSSVDFLNSKKVQIVNSKDEVLLDAEDGDLVVENNSDLLSFGSTRGEQNGIYKVKANVSDNYTEAGGVTLDIENLKEYVGDVKAAIKDKTISNIAYIGEKLYERINNRLPAYAVKVWWEEPVLSSTGSYATDADGNMVMQVNSVRSSFDIAAAVLRPLSYNTPLSDAFDTAIGSRRLPMFSPLRSYLEKIGNKLMIKMDGIEPLENVTIDLTLKVENGYVYAYDDDMQVVGMFPYDSNGINANEAALNSLVGAILEGVNVELTDDMNSKVIARLNDAICQINDNLGAFNAKVGDFLKYVEDSRYYDYASKVLDIYNKFAQKVNNFLTNPDHYLQVAMIYSDGEGHYHHLSTDANDPVRVSPAGGNAIELLATSYTGDVLVPSYAKYVAITSVNGKKATIEQNSAAGEFVNTVLPGQINRVPVNLSSFKSGDDLTITYVSVDYHGICSMQNYYVTVK